ncbi:beta-glucosidase/6-phospho-beta-glucosidase/beta-galactosidase [Microbacterium natoriense]|uniref:Beta-glucosidase/6-phospho-beta-glucosidase/beta-galactosidase n=1 Tax=Microbacterium natoriense TaxID=284570 RepID=A0AAW8EYA4_9MICO|nr:family 1 glycosylhydrolase [Microbacterium natoriense]MDQ0647372.1 beta-glucosidase/6-phospho-beta-glucosidase/beta-galactosidase [Microbacterium natoriense]
MTGHTPAPRGFLWGAATAAHQIEGGNVNTGHWELEYAPGSTIPEPSGDACDSYHRFPEDIALLADAGLTAYRFSVEWARIEPEEGVVSRAQLDHYRRMIDACRDRGVEPVVTLHHFTFPRWWEHSGGWYSERSTDRFRRFTEVCTALLDDVDWVITINEPNMMVNQTEARIDTENGVNFPGPSPYLARAIASAHHASTEVLRGFGGVKSGWSVANQVFQAVPGWETQRDEWQYWREDFFLEQARQDDFIGVQSYLRTIIGPSDDAEGFGPQPWPEGTERTLTGWEYYPEALGHALRHTHEVTGGIPMVVTENGMATSDDTRRVDYTTGALSAMADAMEDGCDVRGYLHWSLLDNYEWGSFRPTFGLVAVDRETFARSPKPSLSWLGGLARRNVVPRLRTE